MFEVNLRGQVPDDDSYGPQEPDWGGVACCQMAMNGYPPGATSCYIDQTTIWNYIQAHNKEGGTGPWGIGWYADPYAVTKTLNDLCPPQHTWIDVSGPNKEEVLYKLFRWMANYKYPSLVCVFAHDYWDLIVYYKTSDDPRQVTNPNIERIGWNEPFYSSWLGGPQVDYKEVDGSLWMTSPYYWGAACGGFTSPNCGQIWKDKWVGIGEPPTEEGVIQVEMISRVGKALIDQKEAITMAQRFLKARSQENSPFLQKKLLNLQAAQPMLVQELPPDERQKTEGDVHYYIVPFMNKYEINKAEKPMVRLCVLVNAYTGRFEQLNVFSRPIHYLSERVVHSIARRALGLSRREERKITTELVFSPMGPAVSSALPAWKVAIADQTLFVSQAGIVIGGLYHRSYRGG
jgi:hypothetical protein